MAIAQQSLKTFTSGTHNLLPSEIIPKDAAMDSLSWLTADGSIRLMGGRQTQGASGGAGKNYGEHVAYKVDGTTVRFRKVGTVIQTYTGSTWVDVVTGLSTKDYIFANYTSLAGSFVYCFGPDGIYKIVVANPQSFTSLYDSTKNFKGYALIDRGRAILWGRVEDPTGLYGSYIDAQNSTVYTTVSSESVGTSGSTTYSGTLAFKAGGATRTAFGVVITDGTKILRDNFNGVFTGDGTGAINYTTGTYSVTFSSATAGPVVANYQWENSNAKGVTDFSKSATRLAGEGFVFRQDLGGDPIRTVIPYAGSYFSFKARSCYMLTLDSTDLNATNEPYRLNIGVQTLRSAVATSVGIAFIDTANASKPQLQIIVQNSTGDNFDVKPLFPQFAFINYNFDDCLVDVWDKYILVGCKTLDSTENNRLLLCNQVDKTVDISYYGIRTSARDGLNLYGGDPVSLSTYQLFTGFDDNGTALTNFWTSKGETYGTDVLKKVKRLRFKGQIDANQTVQIYISYDDSDFSLVGVIRGNGSYVNYSATYAIGTAMIGTTNLGGGYSIPVYAFFMEEKIKTSKFRKRNIKFTATGIGYVLINQLTDFDIWTYQDKLPSAYRQKQNVNPQTGSQNNPYPIY